MQEDVYDEDYQDDGFDQGFDYFVHGGEQEVVHTHHVDDFDVFRQIFAGIIEQFVDVVDDFGCIGSGRLEHHGHSTRFTVYVRFVGIRFVPQFNTGNVFQSEYFTVRQRFDYHFAEFFGSYATTFVLHGVLEGQVGLFPE